MPFRQRLARHLGETVRQTTPVTSTSTPTAMEKSLAFAARRPSPDTTVSGGPGGGESMDPIGFLLAMYIEKGRIQDSGPHAAPAWLTYLYDNKLSPESKILSCES